MSLGYGRGYYGDAQLAQPRRSGSGWFKLAAVVGVGAAVWFFWPRKHVERTFTPDMPPPPLPDPAVQAYEDALVASARELKASGAKVELAPHLQHLASRLEG